MKLEQLYIIFALWGLSSLAGASQRAVVKSEQALIYAEIQKVTPIGYVSKGKTVKVGEVARGPYRMFPIVVSGKVCYIQESDLFINEYDLQGIRKSAPSEAKENENKENKLEDNSAEMQVYFQRKTSFEFTFNSFSAGEEWNTFSKDVNARESTARVTNFSARYFFTKRWHFNFGAGLDTYSVADGAATASTFTASAEVNRIIWEYHDFSLKPGLSLMISPLLTGNGLKLNVPLQYHLTERSFLKAGLGYQRVSISNIDVRGEKKSVTLSGVNMFFGIEYYF